MFSALITIDGPRLFSKIGLCKLINIRKEFAAGKKNKISKKNKMSKKNEISKIMDCTDENVDELLRVENPSIQEAIFQLFGSLSTLPYEWVWSETL
jgi:hypothetical protein